MPERAGHQRPGARREARAPSHHRAVALQPPPNLRAYLREKQALVLRASKNPHPEVVDRLKLRVGEGITGWVRAGQPVAGITKS